MADLATLAIIELEANTALFEGVNILRARVGLPVEFLESERMKIMPRFQDRYAGARFKERVARALGEVIGAMGNGGIAPSAMPEPPATEAAHEVPGRQDAIPEMTPPSGKHSEPPRKGGRR